MAEKRRLRCCPKQSERMTPFFTCHPEGVSLKGLLRGFFAFGSE